MPSLILYVLHYGAYAREANVGWRTRRPVAALAAVVAIIALGPTATAHGDEGLVALGRQIAEAITAGTCPSPQAVEQLDNVIASGHDAEAGLLYDELHRRVLIKGMTFSAAWSVATATPGVSAASESLRAFSACFGANGFSDVEYKSMLDSIKANLEAAARAASSPARLVLPSQLAIIVTSARLILDTMPVKYTAEVTVNDSSLGTYSYTIPATGQYDNEDSAESARSALPEPEPDGDPAAYVGSVGAAAEEVSDNLLAPRRRSGYTEAGERLYIQNEIGNTIFTIDNNIFWRWDYNKRYVSEGESSETYNVILDFYPVVAWEFKDWRRNEAKYHGFSYGSQTRGEWYHKITADFRLIINTGPFGEYVLQQSLPYINLYGHFDGDWSHFQGDSKGFNYAYCTATTTERCDTT